MNILFLLHDASLYYEPLGIMYLSSTLKKAGHACSTLQIDQCDDLISETRNKRPDLIAVSTATGIHHYFLQACTTIKEHLDVPVVWGGPHPTLFPDVLKEPGIDFICRGEGEIPLLELIHALEANRPPLKIESIDTKQEGSETRMPLRAFNQDLDALPFADRELINGYKLYARKWKSFIAGRGCPYQCSYCFNHSLRALASGEYIRKRSVNNVVEEISEVKNRYHIRSMDFHDDVFVLNPNWLEEFAEKYRRQVGLPFGCNVRANHVTDRVAHALRHAGCIEVAMGVESGSDRIRNGLLDRHLSKEQIIQAADRIHKAGIRLITQNMISMPTESVEDALETVKLNVRCRPDLSGFSFYQPYPGTKLCDYSIQQNLFDGEINAIPIFMSQAPGIRLDAAKSLRFFRIIRLYPLILKVPLLFPLLGSAVAGTNGFEKNAQKAYHVLVLANYLEKLSFVPRGVLYATWLFLTRERTRYHHYKWFSRRFMFLLDKLRGVESTHSKGRRSKQNLAQRAATVKSQEVAVSPVQ